MEKDFILLWSQTQQKEQWERVMMQWCRLHFWMRRWKQRKSHVFALMPTHNWKTRWKCETSLEKFEVEVQRENHCKQKSVQDRVQSERLRHQQDPSDWMCDSKVLRVKVDDWKQWDVRGQGNSQSKKPLTMSDNWPTTESRNRWHQNMRHMEKFCRSKKAGKPRVCD